MAGGTSLLAWPRESGHLLLILPLSCNGTAHRTGGITAKGAVQGRGNPLFWGPFAHHAHPRPSLPHHQMPIEHAEGSNETQTLS